MHRILRRDSTILKRELEGVVIFYEDIRPRNYLVVR
jgi:hypothetical protein